MRSLAAHGIRPDTDLGQHFLLDENLVDLAIREAGVHEGDVVLEVGAGLGVLTVPLSRAASWVHAVEFDRRLEPALVEALAGRDNVTIHWGDAMRLPLGDLAPPPSALVANLPYSIATPLVLESLWGLPSLERWCVMVQREVVDRWLAAPGGRLYGAPSVLLQLATEVTFRRSVGREVFTPRPRVRLGPGRPAPHRSGALARDAAAGARGVRDAPQDAGQRARAGGRRPRPGRRGPGAARPLAGRPARGARARRLRRADGGDHVDRVILHAPAKINLRLAVGPRGEDGYHPLTTLMVALAGVADIVTAQRADRRVVACPGLEGPANLAWKALDVLEAEVGRALPLEVRIEKGIPAQAGLGGGSSDAAATLVAADRIHGLGLGDQGLERVAAEVGSDVPFFVRAGAQWARGRGERLRPAFAPAFTAVLAKAPGGLSTAAVYAAFDQPAAAPAGRRRRSAARAARPGGLGAQRPLAGGPRAAAVPRGDGARPLRRRRRGGAAVRQRIVPRRALPRPGRRNRGPRRSPRSVVPRRRRAAGAASPLIGRPDPPRAGGIRTVRTPPRSPPEWWRIAAIFVCRGDRFGPWITFPTSPRTAFPG